MRGEENERLASELGGQTCNTCVHPTLEPLGSGYDETRGTTKHKHLTFSRRESFSPRTRVQDTRRSMLMHHSEPLADANDPPREVSIQLQQLADNSAPPAQPTGSTPFAPPAENDSEPTQNYMADANGIPREVSIQLQPLAGDAQQEEGRNSAPPAPPTGSTPFAPPAANDQGNNIVPANALLIAIDGSVVYDIV